jgi:hypothetical protein
MAIIITFTDRRTLIDLQTDRQTVYRQTDRQTETDLQTDL